MLCVLLQLVGSAPQFPHGVIDPIVSIAKVSKEPIVRIFLVGGILFKST